MIIYILLGLILILLLVLILFFYSILKVSSVCSKGEEKWQQQVFGKSKQD